MLRGATFLASGGGIGVNLGDLTTNTINEFSMQGGYMSSLVGVGIKMPASSSICAGECLFDGVDIQDGVPTAVSGWQGAMGRMSFPPCEVATATDQASIATLSLIDITGLQCPLAANRTYSVNCHIQYTTNVNTTGIGLAINGPASPTSVAGRITMCDATVDCMTAAVNNYIDQHVNAYDTALVGSANAGTSTNIHGAMMDFIIVNGANAGTFSARVRSEVTTGGANVTVKAGSYCRVTEIVRSS